MKKASRSLSLALMGSLALGLGGCGDDTGKEDFRAYKTVNDCVEQKEFTPEECRDMAVAAVKQNPQFANKEECEAKFGAGNCDTVPAGAQNIQGVSQASGGSSWMPLMAGYMMGRYMGGGGMMQGSQPLYPSQQPQQQGAATTFRTAGGATVQPGAGGKVANPGANIRQGFAATAKPAAIRSGATSRGGFSGSKGFGTGS